MLRKPRVGRKLLVASIGVATMTYVGTTSGCSTSVVGNLMAQPGGTTGSSEGPFFGSTGSSGGGSGSGSATPDAGADHAADGPITAPDGNLIFYPIDAQGMDSSQETSSDATSPDAASADVTSADSPQDAPSDSPLIVDVLEDWPIANLIVPPLDAGSTD